MLDVVVGEVEVAAQQEPRLLAHAFLKLRQQLAVAPRVEGVGVVGMRRGDQMRDPVGSRDAAHHDRHLQRLRPVVNARQRMTMNVDHQKGSSPRAILPRFLLSGLCHHAEVAATEAPVLFRLCGRRREAAGYPTSARRARPIWNVHTCTMGRQES